MDDISWEFFINNSPKLVEKRSFKTPLRNIEKLQDEHSMKTLINAGARENSNRKKSVRGRSSSRTVYREITPIEITAKNVNSRVVAENKSIKPLRIMELMEKVTQEQKLKAFGPSLKKLGRRGNL